MTHVISGDSGTWDLSPDVFRILIVCTGNLYRSPLVAGMLQQGLDEVAPGSFTVDSAGIEGATGEPAPTVVRALASEWGFDLSGFRARRLGQDDTSAADLILTMELRQRSLTVSLDPRALRRTFTLREFARIIPDVPPETEAAPEQRWRSLVAMAQRFRTPPPGGPESDDVIDPHVDWDGIHGTMIGQLMPSLQVLVDWEYRNGRFSSHR